MLVSFYAVGLHHHGPLWRLLLQIYKESRPQIQEWKFAGGGNLLPASFAPAKQFGEG